MATVALLMLLMMTIWMMIIFLLLLMEGKYGTEISNITSYPWIELLQ